MSKGELALLVIQVALIASANGSLGDRSQYYNQCISKCNVQSCRKNGDFKEKPSFALRLLFWTCREDCSYGCMWKTVEEFTRYELEVPQFHGKWPFVRLFGIQEPASTFFSILNFLAHFTLYGKFKKEVRSQFPMSLVWTYFSVVCLNGWFWSTIFHARDKPFTEVMDYSCAFAIVLTLLYCMLVRLTYGNTKAFAVITGGYASTLYMHLMHLWSGQINYGYNMKFNVVVGFLTFLITMAWWYRDRRKLSHLQHIGFFNVLTVTVTLLELADFPPIFWLFDAHSLWHASTVPLTVLLYRFITLDCLYLRKNYDKDSLDLSHLH